MSRDELAKILAERDEMARQLAWFKRQLFGPKSERRLVPDSGSQLWLGNREASEETMPTSTTTVGAHERRRRTESAESPPVRFDDTVPVETVRIPNLEIPAEELDQYVKVSEKVTERLAQRPAAYVVLRIVREVYKHKKTERFSCPPAPISVLEKSTADVSFLAGMLIDKLAYHLPLYRQHQRLAAGGVRIARSTLTNYFHRAADLLGPIFAAQFESILESNILAMDETPIKAGRKKGKPPNRGKMKTGYFWPVYGDRDEVAFVFSPTRAHAVVERLLADFSGTLIADGYEAYEKYAAKRANVVHAQCWAHARRKFLDAEAVEPALVASALQRIAQLYKHESDTSDLDPEHVVAHRRVESRPIVDAFFEEVKTALDAHILLPTSPYTKAARYALDREAALRVFLEDPAVALDTNHLERTIRPVALGRKNWMFCTTEVGAEALGWVQSLIVTCRLHGVDPFVYLVDVLQRVSFHPASKVHELTPREWKTRFADEPLQSMLDKPKM
jgi:transposase